MDSFLTGTHFSGGQLGTRDGSAPCTQHGEPVGTPESVDGKYVGTTQSYVSNGDDHNTRPRRRLSVSWFVNGFFPNNVEDGTRISGGQLGTRDGSAPCTQHGEPVGIHESVDGEMSGPSKAM